MYIIINEVTFIEILKHF